MRNPIDLIKDSIHVQNFVAIKFNEENEFTYTKTLIQLEYKLLRYNLNRFSTWVRNPIDLIKDSKHVQNLVAIKFNEGKPLICTKTLVHLEYKLLIYNLNRFS